MNYIDLQTLHPGRSSGLLPATQSAERKKELLMKAHLQTALGFIVVVSILVLMVR